MQKFLPCVCVRLGVWFVFEMESKHGIGSRARDIRGWQKLIYGRKRKKAVGLPFVIYRWWRLIGFHATDVDYHWNTVGIKLFYTLNKTLSTFPYNVQCKRIHEWSVHRHAVQLDYALLTVHGLDDTIHGNYHNNVFHTVHIQRRQFSVLFHTFDIVTLHVHRIDRLSIPLYDRVVNFVHRRHQRKQFYDKWDMLMNKPHLQTAGIGALVNLAFPHRSSDVMYKLHPNQLHSKY